MSRELDEQIAWALGYETLWADGGFGMTLYLHDSGAVRESANVTGNCHILRLTWQLLRVNGEAGEYRVRRTPEWSERHEDARMLEDEIERRGLQIEYSLAIARLLSFDMKEFSLDDAWLLLRATPEQRARAFLEAIAHDQP